MKHDIPRASSAAQYLNGLRPVSARRVALPSRNGTRSVRNRFFPSGILAIFVVLVLAVAPRGSAAAEVKAGPAGTEAAAAAQSPSVPPAEQAEMQGTVESPPQRAGVVTVPIGRGQTATLLAGFRGRWVPNAGWVVQIGPREQTQCGPGPSEVLRTLCVSW